MGANTVRQNGSTRLRCRGSVSCCCRLPPPCRRETASKPPSNGIGRLEACPPEGFEMASTHYPHLGRRGGACPRRCPPPACPPQLGAVCRAKGDQGGGQPPEGWRGEATVLPQHLRFPSDAGGTAAKRLPHHPRPASRRNLCPPSPIGTRRPLRTAITSFREVPGPPTRVVFNYVLRRGRALPDFAGQQLAAFALQRA